MPTEARISIFEQDAGPDLLDRAALHLRQELLELDVERVDPLGTGSAPPGARGMGVTEVGALAVSLGQTADLLRKVIDTVRHWLGRSNDQSRSVTLRIGDDTLEISAASAAEQSRLIDLFVARNTMPGTDDGRSQRGPADSQ